MTSLVNLVLTLQYYLGYSYSSYFISIYYEIHSFLTPNISIHIRVISFKILFFHLCATSHLSHFTNRLDNYLYPYFFLYSSMKMLIYLYIFKSFFLCYFILKMYTLFSRLFNCNIMVHVFFCAFP